MPTSSKKKKKQRGGKGGRKKKGERRSNNNNDTAKNEAAELELEETLEVQMELERLQLSDGASTKNNNGDVKQCRHGCVGSVSLSHSCQKFMNSDAIQSIISISTRGKPIKQAMLSMGSICDWVESIESNVHGGTWSAKDKKKWFVSQATDHFLCGEHKRAKEFAFCSSFIEDFIERDLFMAQNTLELMTADARTIVSYLKMLIPCNCLDENYEQLKYQKNTGCCVNVKCSLPERRVEFSKMMTCSGCLMVHYCGRECQKTDWKRHKQYCKLLSSVQIAADADGSRDTSSVNLEMTAIIGKL